jgi:hypothetical protein
VKASTRKRLPKSKFASPKGQAPDRTKNQFPIDTAGRAANAKARATQMVKKGKLSPSKGKQIKARASRALSRMKKS